MTRTAPLLAAVLAASVPVGATAAAGRQLLVYPLQADGVAEAEVRALEAVVAVAVRRMGPNGPFSARPPARAPKACGPARSATVGCLAKLAGPSVVLRASVLGIKNSISFALSLVDGEGRTVGPERVSLGRRKPHPDSVVIALQALADALAKTGGDTPAKAPEAAAPPPLPATVATAPAPASSRAATAKPAPAAALAPSPRRLDSVVVRRVGIGTAAAGAIVVGTGVAFGLAARELDAELRRKHDANLLRRGDLATFEAMDSRQSAANWLFLAGGLAAASGLAVWAWSFDLQARPDGARASVSGRF